MKVYFVFIFLFTFITGATAKSESTCVEGFSSVWKFDQKELNIGLEEITPKPEICNFIQAQMGANIKIDLKKGNEVIFSNKIFWSELTQHESFVENKITGKIVKQTDYKVVKFPIQKSSVDSYVVTNISSGKVLGKGVIK